MFDLGQYLPYLVNRAGVRLAVNFDRDIRAHGVAVQEWRVLAALAAHGGQRLSDLAILTSTDLSTLSRLVGRMTTAGLVTRSRAAGDKRAVLVALTPHGERTTQAILPTARRYERIALRGIGADEAALLKRLLERVYANLDALEATPE
ncbi:MAG: MarR family transcriptional regulator [Rhodospirillales bacterium]|nr:MarR family transcriptional regulator [Rhodospirillales bacterium]